MSQAQGYELRPIDQEQDDSLTRQASISYTLPPADRGKDAWLVLASGYIVEALVWGLAFSYGVFQEHYTNLEQFRGQQSTVASIGTVANGLLFFAAPITSALCRQYPHMKRKFMIAGLVIMSCGFIGASFATQVWHLILTQGVLFAVGGCLVYYPVFLLIDEWFVQRKGLAYGIMWSSTGFSGFVLPYIIAWLLSSYGFRTALRAWAVVNVVCLVVAIPFLKSRIPPSMIVRTRIPSLRFATTPIFLTFQVGNILQGLGAYFPAIFLPLYVRSIGLSSTVGTTSVSLVNIGTFVGYVVVGLLIDRWKVANVVGFLTIGSVIVVALMWGFANSSALVIVFALLFGFFGASFPITWAGIVGEVMRQEQNAEASAVFCLLVSGRGLGSLVSGPLSRVLLSAHGITKNFTYGYGSDYGTLILFTASSMVAGGVAFICKPCLQRYSQISST